MPRQSMGTTSNKASSILGPFRRIGHPLVMTFPWIARTKATNRWPLLFSTTPQGRSVCALRTGPPRSPRGQGAGGPKTVTSPTSMLRFCTPGTGPGGRRGSSGGATRRQEARPHRGRQQQAAFSGSAVTGAVRDRPGGRESFPGRYVRRVLPGPYLGGGTPSRAPRPFRDLGQPYAPETGGGSPPEPSPGSKTASGWGASHSFSACVRAAMAAPRRPRNSGVCRGSAAIHLSQRRCRWFVTCPPQSGQLHGTIGLLEAR